MRKNKLFLMVFATILMAFIFTACSGEASVPSSTKEAVTDTETVIEPEAQTEPSTSVEAMSSEDTEAFVEYINQQINGDFGPKYDEITNKYTEAVESGDGDILANTLKEILIQGGHLYEDLEQFQPKTADIEELHALMFTAVAERELGFVLLLDALTNPEFTQTDVDDAFNKLDEAMSLFNDFMVKRDELIKKYGF